MTYFVNQGHAAGSSVLNFNYEGISYVLTGDECYICDNMEYASPVGTHVDLQRNHNFLKVGLIGEKIPLPCHDGRLLEAYLKWIEHILKIVA